MKVVTVKILEVFLKKNGVENIKHIKNGSLFDHFTRVAQTLNSWKVENHVV